MTESTREHYNELAGAVVRGTHPILPRPEWGQDCAYLAHVLDTQSAELVKLRHDVAEWMCRECRYVYPGPPQPGLRAVICPRCDGPTMPRATIDLMEAEEKVERLRGALAACIEDVDACTYLYHEGMPGDVDPECPGLYCHVKSALG